MGCDHPHQFYKRTERYEPFGPNGKVQKLRVDLVCNECDEILKKDVDCYICDTSEAQTFIIFIKDQIPVPLCFTCENYLKYHFPDSATEIDAIA